MPVSWQPSTLQPKNAEAVLVTALSAALTTAGEVGVHVDRTLPQTLSDRMVIITRDGGRFNGVIDQARMRIRVFDLTDDDCDDLSSTVVRLVAGLVPATATHVDHQSGPITITGGSEQPQRYHLFDIHLRGEAP